MGHESPDWLPVAELELELEFELAPSSLDMMAVEIE